MNYWKNLTRGNLHYGTVGRDPPHLAIILPYRSNASLEQKSIQPKRPPSREENRNHRGKGDQPRARSYHMVCTVAVSAAALGRVNMASIQLWTCTLLSCPSPCFTFNFSSSPRPSPHAGQIHQMCHATKSRALFPRTLSFRFPPLPLADPAVLACWTPSSNSSTYTCQSLLGLKGTGMFLARHGFS